MFKRLLVLCLSFLCLAAFLSVADSGTIKILNNVFVNDTDVGGLTHGEAVAMLNEKFSITDMSITIHAHERVYNHSFADFGAGYDFAAAVQEAVDFSEPNGFFTDLRRKWTLKTRPMRFSAEFIYDELKILEISKKIANDIHEIPKDATYSINENEFTITRERIGREADENAIAADITAILQSKASGEVVAHITETFPELTHDIFAASTQLLGSFQTPFDQTRAERAVNLRVASSYLNNQIILPGQVLSVCNALRPRTLENGYVEAGQITHGQPDRGVGGGICQISSTLYMAALYAEMDIVQRRNHSLLVAYMGPATDATIAEGAIDLQIKNNTSHPMLIQSAITPHRHIINIFGHETRPLGRHIHFESELLEIFPADDKIVEDPLLPFGQSQVVSLGMDGAKFELYKIITHPDGRMERVKVNTSHYKPLQRVVKTGTFVSR
ncbi:MAG: VanW family protein [Defluviitaleaceae bacterium]|nr:VanW family protein [Defluviitaleaceae bacterium]